MVTLSHGQVLARLAAAAAMFTLAPGAAGGGAGTRLRPGVFLYAAPDLRTPHFTESVVLLVRHEPEGSLGLIINRPTRLLLRNALEELGEMPGLDLALYFGGPVQPEAMLALVRSAKPIRAGTRLLPDVYFCTDLDPVKAAARRPEAASRLRVYAGYAGWGPGQLAEELRRGAWIVGPADARSIFSSDPSATWPRVYDLLQRIEALFGRPPQAGPSSPRGPVRFPHLTERGDRAYRHA